MASQLSKLSPIRISGEVLPPPQLFVNIPMLHRILEEVLNDWLRAVEPYQRQIDSAEGDAEKLPAALSGFVDLQPFLLKCLFSYAFFFVAADDAYAHFYAQLNLANRLSGHKVPHSKPPNKPPFINKISTIRDIAIAHFPSKKARALDAYAAMSWQPMALSFQRGECPNLEELTFAPGRFRGTEASGQSLESQDLEVSGVRTTHIDHCMPYLEELDKVCCDYLRALQFTTKSGP